MNTHVLHEDYIMLIVQINTKRKLNINVNIKIV
jgi:hypothetical protein